jgi:hypothetical protein
LTHKFTVGQTVFFSPTRLHGAVAGDYEVLRLMPQSDTQPVPSYRIKSVTERHERVASESDLMLPDEVDSFSHKSSATGGLG